MGQLPEDFILIDDDVWKNAKITMAPMLPKTEFKVWKTTYSITDFRYLNEHAKYMFNYILQRACNTPLGKCVCFGVSKEVTDENLRIAIEIITSIFYEVRRKGRNGLHADGTFLVHGCWTKTQEDGNRVITLDIDENLAMHIFEYAQERKADGVLQIPFNELIAEALNRSIEELSGKLKEVIDSESEDTNETSRH
jgi:hypothetical protein